MMRFLLSSLAAAVLAAPVAAQDTTTTADSATVAVATTTPTTVPVNRIVAVVGTRAILWSDVLEFINARRAQGMQLPTDPAGQRALFEQAVNELIDEEVLIQQAQSLAIEVTDAELTASVDQQLKRVRGQFASEQAFRDELRAAGLGTPEDYRRSLMDQARRYALQQRVIEKLRQDGKLPPAGVTDAEVQAAFEKNRASLPRRPASVAFRQIVVGPRPSADAKAAARAKADSLLVEIRKGGDFEQIAKRESMDPGTKDVGGDLGWARRGTFVPEFERVAFALPPGQVSPVVETPFGYHIIKVERVQPAEVKVRHILIRPRIDSADVAAARVRADSVLALWNAGTPYDTLVARFHDKAEERIIPEIEREQLPDTYRTAIEGRVRADVVGPFEIPDPASGTSKYVVLQLDALNEGGEYSLADMQQTIRQQLAQEKAFRRLIDSLRRSTFVEVKPLP